MVIWEYFLRISMCLKLNKVNGFLSGSLAVEGDFIIRVHSRVDDVLQESINGGEGLCVIRAG